jgi:glycosyltransferase involved in cell wall biosynthesis
MRVALMTEPFLPKIDGVVTMLTKTVKHLRAGGDEVLIFAPNGGPKELYGAEVVGLPSAPFVLYPELRLALPRARMRAKLEEFQPDVMHLFEPLILGVAGIYYSEVLRIPLVISSHTNIAAYGKYHRLGFLENAVWRTMRIRHLRAGMNLATSSVTMKDLEEHGIENLVLWERAVDAEMFSPAARSEEMRCRLSGGEPEKPLLLYVGRLSAEKDVVKLRAVVEAIPGARLGIVGDGPARVDLERRFAGTATVFLGYLRGAELASAFASADLFLFPSQTETLGLVLMEAMAAGCPVVACRAGGIPDAVKDGVTGYLFDPGVKDALVTTVKRALANWDELDEVRVRARADAVAHSWEASTEQLRGLYAETIRRGPPPKRPETKFRRAVSRSFLWGLRRALP